MTVKEEKALKFDRRYKEQGRFYSIVLGLEFTEEEVNLPIIEFIKVVKNKSYLSGVQVGKSAKASEIRMALEIAYND